MIGAAALSAKKARLLKELRREGIRDGAVLDAIEQTPRELFVPSDLREDAYDNVALPIGRRQTISQPFVVALMTEKLALKPTDKVLEIGTGCGYQAAVLARLAAQIFSIERLQPLLMEAKARFAELALHNITCRCGDGSQGWPEQAPFDRVIVTAAAETIPPALVEQMAPGGIMVVPVGPQDGDQKLLRLRRDETSISTEDLGPVRFVPLVETKAHKANDATARA